MGGDKAFQINWGGPLGYGDFVRSMKLVLRKAATAHPVPLEESLADTLMAVDDLSAHSPRVTIVNAMAVAGASGPTLQLQGNWKDPAMPERYVRDRKAIPLTFLRAMMADIKEGWRATDSGSAERLAPETDENGAEVDLADVEHVVQADTFEASFWERPREPGSGALKIHILSAKVTGQLACNKFALSTCVPCDRYQEADAVYCKDCLRARPDAAPELLS